MKKKNKRRAKKMEGLREIFNTPVAIGKKNPDGSFANFEQWEKESKDYSNGIGASGARYDIRTGEEII